MSKDILSCLCFICLMAESFIVLIVNESLRTFQVAKTQLLISAKSFVVFLGSYAVGTHYFL